MAQRLWKVLTDWWHSLRGVHCAMMPIAKVAERAGLSPSPCWRRIQKLIEDGIILRRVALLDPNKVNAGVNVFVSIRTNQHTLEWASKFCRAAAQIPEVPRLPPVHPS